MSKTTTKTTRTVACLLATALTLACLGLVAAGCGGMEGEEGLTSASELDSLQQPVTGCGPLCRQLCYIMLHYCEEHCGSSGCVPDCIEANIQCLQDCECTEECITDADCPPGYVCAGSPGSRTCLFLQP